MGRHVVIGAGGIGRATAELLARGEGRVGVLAPTVTDGLADGVIELAVLEGRIEGEGYIPKMARAAEILLGAPAGAIDAR